MDLIERMNPALEELPVDGDAVDGDPARIALPVLLDLLPVLPEDLGAFRPRGSMTLLHVALRLLRRIPDENVRAAVVRSVFADTKTFSSRLILLWVVGHRENIGVGLVGASTAVDLEDELRSALITQSPGDFAAQDRITRLADLMAETEDGKAALRHLAEDNGVMLSLLVDSVGATLGQEVGAAAVTVTKVLPAWLRTRRRPILPTLFRARHPVKRDLSLRGSCPLREFTAGEHASVACTIANPFALSPAQVTLVR